MQPTDLGCRCSSSLQATLLLPIWTPGPWLQYTAYTRINSGLFKRNCKFSLHRCGQVQLISGEKYRLARSTADRGQQWCSTSVSSVKLQWATLLALLFSSAEGTFFVGLVVEEVTGQERKTRPGVLCYALPEIQNFRLWISDPYAGFTHRTGDACSWRCMQLVVLLSPSHIK